MSYTKEVTLWCDTMVDDYRCGVWVQYAHNDAAGSVVIARRLAHREGWASNQHLNTDTCPKHVRITYPR
jgi:hypothetical protein